MHHRRREHSVKCLVSLSSASFRRSHLGRGRRPLPLSLLFFGLPPLRVSRSCVLDPEFVCVLTRRVLTNLVGGQTAQLRGQHCRIPSPQCAPGSPGSLCSPSSALCSLCSLTSHPPGNHCTEFCPPRSFRVQSRVTDISSIEALSPTRTLNWTQWRQRKWSLTLISGGVDLVFLHVKLR